MTLRIYNTLTKQKDEFIPQEPGKVRMYVCGPTVYDSCHIGHARSVVVFDVIARYLRMKGYDVTYVRNFTDVDDKIINRANELGVDCQTISEKYIREFYQDMDALNVERATIEPRATEHIGTMIRFIEKLIEKGKAYTVNGDVYYAVETFKDYGKLSGRKLDEMEAGARVEVDERKRNPFDFALWKSAKPGEPFWDSPWGKGRPGWHIECSAMSHAFFGESFDIHGGGKDLIFPHHENEIAQSEGLFEKPFVSYWIHNGFININQEKMSKSLGNFLMIKDVLQSYHPEAIRLFLLSSHYRSPLDFSDQAMAESATALDKIYTFLARAESLFPSGLSVTDRAGDVMNAFIEAMDDDFNTARSIGIIFEAVRNSNRLLDDHSSNLSPDIKDQVKLCVSDILKIGKVLGVFIQSPQAYFETCKSLGIKKSSVDISKIEQMIRDRNDARKARDWAKADAIRKALSDMNIILEDRPDGTVWKVKT